LALISQPSRTRLGLLLSILIALAMATRKDATMRTKDTGQQKPIGNRAIRAAVEAAKPRQVIVGTPPEEPTRSDLATRHPIGRGAAASAIEAIKRSR
jgi:hypothetical protein